MNCKKGTILFLILTMFVMTVASSAVAQSTHEEIRTFYYHGEEEPGGLVVEVNATKSAYPGQKINITVEVKACTKIHVLYMNFNIFGLKNEINETLLESIMIWELKDSELNISDTRQYLYEITVPEDISPGSIYGTIWYEWTCWGTLVKIAPTSFRLTYINNKELENLRKEHTQLKLNYTWLLGNYTEYSDELGTTRNMVYVFIVTTVVSAVSAVFFLMRRPKKWW